MVERRGIADFLFGQAAEAIADIRSKLIDEGWFGRRSPATPTSLGWEKPGGTDAPVSSFEEQWAAREPGQPSPAAPDHGIDR